MTKTTKNLRDIVANLRHVANLLDVGGDSAELPAGVDVAVIIGPAYGPMPTDEDAIATVEKIALVLGVESAWAEPTIGSNYAHYRADVKQETWNLRVSAYLKCPSKVEQLEAENAKLRAALGKIKKIAAKHTEVDGCTCEDCEDLAGCDG